MQLELFLSRENPQLIVAESVLNLDASTLGRCIGRNILHTLVHNDKPGFRVAPAKFEPQTSVVRESFVADSEPELAVAIHSRQFLHLHRAAMALLNNPR